MNTGMQKEVKDTYFVVRISRREKKGLEEAARSQGFDTFSAFVLFHLRKLLQD